MKAWLAGAVIVAALLTLAPMAAAHSTLVSTAPVRDRVVDQPPKHVLLHFDEPVETALGSVAVYDGEGERVDAGTIVRPSPESVRVAIDGELERGTYTVAWRAISADSDPIKGAWVFHVQEPGSQPAGIAAQVLEDTPFTVSAFYLVGRFLDFTLLLLCIGGAAALAFALRSAADPVRRRLFGVLAGLAAGLTLVALVGIGLQGAAAGGGDLADGFRWDSVTSVADTRFGRSSLVRAGIAAVLCVLALVARRRVGMKGGGGTDGRGVTGGPADGTRFPRGQGGRKSGWDEPPSDRGRANGAGQGNGAIPERHPVRAGAVAGQPLVAQARQGVPEAHGHAAAQDGPETQNPAPGHVSESGRLAGGTPAALMLLLAAGIVFTPGLSGHAGVTGVGSVIADAAHVLTAAIWTGGLAFVVAGLMMARAQRWPLAAVAVPRLSTMAVVSVSILIVAGAINGYLQVRAWRGLWETQYGVLLLVKVGLVLPLLALGAYNNRYAVPRLRRQIASVVERRRFIRMAGAELVIMLAVVGVTAGLVNAPPARTEISMHEASEIELRLGPMRADMEIIPATVGPNEIHLKFTKGRPDEVTVTAELKSKDIGPLRYTARPTMEAGAYAVKRANLSPAGDWKLGIEAGRGKFDLFDETVLISIEKEF